MRNCFVTAVLLFAIGARQVQAAPGDLLQTYPNPNPNATTSDEFGAPVAPLGLHDVIVGAQFAKYGNTIGAVYLLDADTGATLHTIIDPVANANNNFASRLAGVGTNWVIIGAPNTSGGDGAAYVYDATTGVLARTLMRTLSPSDGGFGAAVALFDATHVLVSSPGTAAQYGGAVHLFDVTTGVESQQFLNPDPMLSHDAFGSALAAIDSNHILIGDGLRSLGASNVGAAYVMDVTTGAPVLTLQSPSPHPNDHFGESVANIGNNMIAVGAPDDSTFASGAGAVYIFNETTGALLHTLHTPVAQIESRFGASLAVTTNGLLIVGTELDNTSRTWGGAVYAFNAATGQLVDTLLDPHAINFGRFGGSVATLPDNSILVGATQGDYGPGVAYRFSAVPEPTTIVLTAFGVLALLAHRRRR